MDQHIRERDCEVMPSGKYNAGLGLPPNFKLPMPASGFGTLNCVRIDILLSWEGITGKTHV